MPTPLEILLWILSGIAAYGFLTGSYVKDCDYYFHNLKKNPFEKALVPFLLSKLSNSKRALTAVATISEGSISSILLS